MLRVAELYRRKLIFTVLYFSIVYPKGMPCEGFNGHAFVKGLLIIQRTTCFNTFAIKHIGLQRQKIILSRVP